MKCPLWNLTSFKTNLGGHFAFQKSHSINLFITTSIRLEWPVLFLLNRTYLMDDWQNRTINFGFIDSKTNPMIIRPPNWSKVFFTYNLFEAKSSSDEISEITIEVFSSFPSFGNSSTFCNCDSKPFYPPTISPICSTREKNDNSTSVKALMFPYNL